ncbi:matrixin family metalloprotease [Halogeometricum borinquense]|uniref:Matrixin family metalloprotease n=1 Tax=Halogeometricum borinquense TaxID=60847 RepID=A0A482TNA2_9EURY|nr:matrixin family metalloprotease [Halogeometricum borinquense]RYJ14385.1 matrixin family metalloprotease [Halogeometricum borinquense]
MRIRIALVAFLLLLAGCSGTDPFAGEPSSEIAKTTVPSTEKTGAPSPTDAATPTSEPATDRVNPWGHENVSVAVSADLGTYGYGTFHEEIRTALEYWNTRENTSYPVQYELTNTTYDADIVVNVEPRVNTCNGRRAAYSFDYCSDVLSAEDSIDSQIDVSMTGRYDENETRQVAKRMFAGLSGTKDAEASVEPDPNGTPWPWQSTVTVGINASAGGNRDYKPFVAETIAYWEKNQDEYGEYTTDFELRPNEPSPDVEVRIVESIPNCGKNDNSTSDALGCASVLDDGAHASDTEVVRIMYDQSDESIVQTMKHEFGHLYGLEHGEGPMPLMDETYRSETLPRPNATERPLPWRSNTLSVYVDYSNITDSDSEQVEREIRDATDYYEAGAEGYVPGNLTFEYVSDPAEADITIRFYNTFASGTGESRLSASGEDTDGDGALEFYTTGTIHITDIYHDRVGWHVGANLGSLMGAKSHSDLPPPFDGSDDNRDDWN